MGMRITRLAEATSFDPPGHRGVCPVRLQGGEAAPTDGVTVALSHYLPGGVVNRTRLPASMLVIRPTGVTS